MACRPTSPLLTLALMAASIMGCRGVHIVDLVVPDVIQNGSRSSVVLDCVYRYENYEQEGLVVKWFWNHEPEAVYQWIPGKRPEAMGLLKGRVNLDFSADRDQYTMHRALEIMHPTTELTGFFTCRVSSFYDEEFASKKMIVYAPATSMNMSYLKPTPGSVNISCQAHGIFPKPRLRLYRDANKRTRSSVKETEVEVVEEQEGFGIYLQSVLEDRTLRHETIFECLLSIPETEYQVRHKIIYFPGYNTFGGATVVSGAPLHLLLLFSLLLLLVSPADGELVLLT
ncbi:uncharacterized protein [Panulirus ornatus]|uniref:uncharacterized protein isoform X2 n=1 Tax=Panulirus ornatus TaxID=150431 RepID=UPI003A88E69F